MALCQVLGDNLGNTRTFQCAAEGKLAQVLIPTVNDEKRCPLAKDENAAPMHSLFSKVLAITYHHKTSVHAS